MEASFQWKLAALLLGWKLVATPRFHPDSISFHIKQNHIWAKMAKKKGFGGIEAFTTRLSRLGGNL